MMNATMKLASMSSTRGRQWTQQWSYIDQDREASRNRLMQDYFNDPSVYVRSTFVEGTTCGGFFKSWRGWLIILLISLLELMKPSAMVSPPTKIHQCPSYARLW